MNRRKKIKQILAKRDKKASAKKRCSNKPRYISKAERAKLDSQVQEDQAGVIAEQGADA